MSDELIKLLGPGVTVDAASVWEWCDAPGTLWFGTGIVTVSIEAPLSERDCRMGVLVHRESRCAFLPPRVARSAEVRANSARAVWTRPPFRRTPPSLAGPPPSFFC